MRTIHLNVKRTIIACIFGFVVVGGVIYTFTSNNYNGNSDYRQVNTLPRDVRLRKSLDKPMNVNNSFTSKEKDFEEGFVQKEDNVLETDNKAVIISPQDSKEQRVNDVDLTRREKVVEMIRHAWQGYRNFTFGENELRPISHSSNNQNIFGGRNMMATIVDGADTLYLAGLTKEYKEARDYICDHFDINNTKSSFSIFEVTIRHVGGFLALYALTKESFYIEKAQSIVDAMMPAFDTSTGIPKSLINLKQGTDYNYNWAKGSILSEIGSLHLEFRYLSQLTGNPLYLQKVEKIRNVLDEAKKVNGFYANFISQDTGQFVSEDVSIGAMGDSFYEYLIKEWLQSNRTDNQSIRMYKEASETLRNRLSYKSNDNLTYIAEIRMGEVQHKMGHLACFAPGMFALEAMVENDTVTKSKIMEFAEELGKTCYIFYNNTASGIGPEMVYFVDGNLEIRDSENGYVLRPESIEGWFYLWRITKKKIYKEWVWNAISAIDKYCRVKNGFAGLKNVTNPEAGYDDVQQSFFIAETLKYAYLTFADDTLPLDKWVFNTEAHAFPIFTSR